MRRLKFYFPHRGQAYLAPGPCIPVDTWATVATPLVHALYLIQYTTSKGHFCSNMSGACVISNLSRKDSKTHKYWPSPFAANWAFDRCWLSQLGLLGNGRRLLAALLSVLLPLWTASPSRPVCISNTWWPHEIMWPTEFPSGSRYVRWRGRFSKDFAFKLWHVRTLPEKSIAENLARRVDGGDTLRLNCYFLASGIDTYNI